MAKKIEDMKTYSFQVEADYEIRYSNLNGRRHLIVPVVMMREGVHAGSNGPLLHLASELGKFPESWNGIPVTISHPKNNDGEPISANSPQVFEESVVGKIFNTHMVGDKLKAEAWIDVELIRQFSPSTLQMLESKRQMDVSIGCFSDEEMTAGTWQNESYIGIARNHRPDHMALLPGAAGACSWGDGCGVRTNEEKKGENLDVIIKKYNGKDISLFVYQAPAGYRETMELIQRKLDQMDNGLKIHFLVEVYKDTFIYRVQPTSPGPEALMYQQKYTVENGTVDFVDQPNTVRQEVKYISANENGGDPIVDTNEKKKPCAACPKKVDQLISNKAYPFIEQDREYLLTLDGDHLDKVITMGQELTGQIEELQTNAKPKELTKEEHLRALAGKLTTNEFMELIPAEVREQVQHGAATYKAQKDTVVKKIAAHSSKAFTEEELNQKSFAELQKIEKMLPADYSLNDAGDNFIPTLTVNDLMLPVGVTVKE